MSTPTPLDALKHVSLAGIDILDYVTEDLVINYDVDEDGHLLKMLDNVRESMHQALQSQVPYRLTELSGPIVVSQVPHSNTYEQARFYSDGTPVYYDESCTVPIQDEDGMTHLTPSTRRVFRPMPNGGEPA